MSEWQAQIRRDALSEMENHAFYLLKGEAPESTIKGKLYDDFEKLDAGFPLYSDSDINTYISACINNALKRILRNGTDEEPRIYEWIMATDAWFWKKSIYEDLCIKPWDREGKKKVTDYLNYLIKDNVIESHKSMQGKYRKVNHVAVKIDLFKKDPGVIPVYYPLDLHLYHKSFHRNVVVFAGTPEAGKTAMALEMLRLNLDVQVPKVYMQSEGSPAELRDRLALFNMPIQQWADKVEWLEVPNNWHDNIVPNGINVIDYMAAPEENLWAIGEYIDACYKKLTTGMVIICLQKKFGHRLAYGQEFTLHRPRMYINLEAVPGGYKTAEIVKLKTKQNSFKYEDFNGKKCTYKFGSGSQIELEQPWHWPQKTKRG